MTPFLNLDKMLKSGYNIDFLLIKNIGIKMRRPQNLCNVGMLEWIMNNMLENVDSDYEIDCWIPVKSRRPLKDERCLLYWNKKNMLGYRATWEMWNDQIFPEGLVARHICGDARCINPIHIKPGTPQENEADKTAKEIIKPKTKLSRTPADITDEEKVDFWLENHVREEDGCLIFLGGTGVDGYGRRNVEIKGMGRKKVEVHRWTYCIKNNVDYFDKSWVARHTCNTRSCINPEHIVSGTRSENARDARSYSKSTKLKEENVREIIEKFLEVEAWPIGSKAVFSQKYAEKFDVSISSVHNIVFRRKTWKDILQEYNLV